MRKRTFDAEQLRQSLRENMVKSQNCSSRALDRQMRTTTSLDPKRNKVSRQRQQLLYQSQPMPKKCLTPYNIDYQINQTLNELSQPNICSIPSSISSKNKKVIGNPVNSHLFNTMVDRSQPGFLTDLGRRIEPIRAERQRIAITTSLDQSFEQTQPKRIITEPLNLQRDYQPVVKEQNLNKVDREHIPIVKNLKQYPADHNITKERNPPASADLLETKKNVSTTYEGNT